ncbi:MAG TPA: cation-efflux pump [Anaerolineales bacterium]|nr:cation-efflux pump [Anaerolineales bacterium]
MGEASQDSLRQDISNTDYGKTAEREKRRVALSSVLAAVFLTAMKLTVGLLTNSLGILSEAAHSGLDLVAAGVTYLAVRVSGRPPDREHPYGHGKVENLSALLETALLFVTCAWIVYEAIQRLLRPVHVQASFWSFAVMGASIVIDLSRSRALMRAARKHKSQALEADALHFSTDVWSSSVVILGLLAVWFGQWLGANSPVHVDWLYRADSVAALGVSGIVVYVSLQLGRRTVNALLDSAEVEIMTKIENGVGELPGVSEVRRVRVRQSGASAFVDMTIAVPRSASLEQAHLTADAVEELVQRLLPRADVMVSIAPVVKDQDSLLEQIRSVAARQGLGVHGIRAHDVHGRLSLEMHVEVPDDITIGTAHEQATAFEKLLRREVQGITGIVTHIEPVGDAEARRPAVRTASADLREAISDLPNQVPGVRDCHSITIHREADDLSVSFHCLVNPDVSVGEAHRLTIELESRMRARFPELGRVVIHTEPGGRTTEGSNGGSARGAR